MPCLDVTETVRVVLDPADRLKSYSYVKDACGRDVGHGSFLLDALRGCSVQELLAQTPEAFLNKFPSADAVEEFLKQKHFVALQSALEVLTGREPGGPDDVCAAASLSCEGGDLTITARIRVDLLASSIRPCGVCPGCPQAPEEVR